MLTAFDFEPVMFANVPQAVYDYTAHGDGGEWNLRRNRQAFDWVDLLPGRAIDPASVDLSSQLLNLKLKYPIVIAPTATQVALHPDGEAGMYRAAALSSNTPMCLSNNSSQSIEQVAKGAQGQLWWQFYPRQDMSASQRTARARAGRRLHRHCRHRGSAGVLLRAESARSQSWWPGCRPRGRSRPRCRWAPRRSNDPEATPPSPARRGPQLYRIGGGRLWYTWQYLDDIRKFIKVPIIIKGIVTHEDARLCVERGVRWHRRLESRRTIDGLRAIDDRGAARDRCGGQRQGFR